MQADLQRRLASWDWSSDGAGEQSSRRRFVDSEEGGAGGTSADEEVFAGVDARSRTPSQATLQDNAPAAYSFASASSPSHHNLDTSFSQPLPPLEPSDSYQNIAAIPSPIHSPAIDFTSVNPFDSLNPPTFYPSTIRPSRPPSMVSFLPESASRPPLTIDPNFSHSRDDSRDSTTSIYSDNERQSPYEEAEPTTARIEPSSFFSPITPVELRKPLSGLAISSSTPPRPSPISPRDIKRTSRQSPLAFRSPALSRTTSSQSTATSYASPVFDVNIFSTPATVSTVASSTFDSSSFTSSCPHAKPMSRIPSSSSHTSSTHHLTGGTWRQDWAVNARMSRYISRDEFELAKYEAKQREPTTQYSDESEEDREEDGDLSLEEEQRRIEEFCEREMMRRKTERHERFLEEQERLARERRERKLAAYL